MAKSRAEFEAWQEELISDFTREFNVSKRWAREMSKVLVSMSVGYHLGYSSEEYKADQVDVDMAQRAVDAESALKHMNKQYGIASQKIHALKAENALLRAKLKELEGHPAVLVNPGGSRVFYAGDPEPKDKESIVLRSSKPHFSTEEVFNIRFYQRNPREDMKWWSDVPSPTWSSWDRWLKAYGPFAEVL